MIAALLVVLAAGPEEPPERDVAVFTAPMAIPLAAAFPFIVSPNLIFNNAVVFVPIGASFTAAESEWCIDAALMQRSAIGPELGFAGFWFSFGPVIHTGLRPLRGLFFTPKISVGGFRFNSAIPGQFGDGQTTYNFTVGADFGYQFTVGRLYFAFLFGASVGAGWGEGDNYAGPIMPLDFLDLSGNAKPVVGLNLQLFRVGYTF